LAAADHAAAVSRLTAECDSLREKVAVLQVGPSTHHFDSRGRTARILHRIMWRAPSPRPQTECTRLEITADRDKATLEAQLHAAREKAGEYERLEVELDTAIISAGNAEAAGEDDGAVTGSLRRTSSAAADALTPGGSRGPPLLMTGSLGMSLAAGVPTSARRRLRQTILLAKELSRSQAEATELRRLLAAARVDIEYLRTADESIRAQLDAVAGPQVGGRGW
jgi:hypothetical protein